MVVYSLVDHKSPFAVYLHGANETEFYQSARAIGRTEVEDNGRFGDLAMGLVGIVPLDLLVGDDGRTQAVLQKDSLIPVLTTEGLGLNLSSALVVTCRVDVTSDRDVIIKEGVTPYGHSTDDDGVSGEELIGL